MIHQPSLEGRGALNSSTSEQLCPGRVGSGCQSKPLGQTLQGQVGGLWAGHRKTCKIRAPPNGKLHGFYSKNSAHQAETSRTFWETETWHERVCDKHDKGNICLGLCLATDFRRTMPAGAGGKCALGAARKAPTDPCDCSQHLEDPSLLFNTDFLIYKYRRMTSIC